MRTKVDPSGRVVIPARVRRALGVEHGGEVDVVDTPDGLLIRPVTRAVIARRGGLRVITLGRPVSAAEVRDAIDEDREQRA